MKSRELVKAFRTKFHLTRSEGADHTLYHKKYKGEEIFVIPVPRGKRYRDIGDTLLNEMAQQCYLQLGPFKKSVDCTYSEEEFHSLALKGWRQKHDKT